MNHYEAKQEARRERLERAAEKARQESERRYNAVHNRLDGIPFGQPILVGHHSEKRHRRDLERADNDMRKGVEASKRAGELAARAAAVGSGGISSDDPDAIDKLREKLAELEAKQDRMKAVNAAIRKHAKAGREAQLAALTALGLSANAAEGALTPDCFGGIGFPSYSLSNNSNNMRRYRQRIAQLERLAERVAAEPEPAELELHGASIIEDAGENRVLLRFPARLSRDDYKAVRSMGFVWSPSRNAFVRKLSTGATWAARHLVERILGAATEGASK
jgi:hypothetical protein